LERKRLEIQVKQWPGTAGRRRGASRRAMRSGGDGGRRRGGSRLNLLESIQIGLIRYTGQRDVGEKDNVYAALYGDGLRPDV
jgi:hypothetical protein